MKLEIPLQFVLVCFLILGVSVFLGALYYKESEPFVDMKLSQSDIDIQLQACPSGTSSYDEKGDIYCCEGDIVNERCNGRIVCSVSLDKENLPSCVNLLRKELREKGAKFCPPTLPFYFEDKQTKISGCTDKKRTADGKKPLEENQPKCILYGSASDTLNKLNSCENIKERDLYKCPEGKKAILTNPRPNRPVLVQCDFTTNVTPQPITCYSDTSLLNHLKEVSPGWRGTLDREAKLKFCSTAKAYYINRSITEEELQMIEGPFTTVPRSTTCIFNARMYADRYPDVKKAFGYNERLLKKHYIDYGIREGREYKMGCRFEPLVYADLNPDIKRTFKSNKNSITNHYKMSGINENRIFRRT